MKELVIDAKTGTSRLIAGAPFAMIFQIMKQPASVFVVDSNVRSLYPQYFHNCSLIEIPGGEASKNLETINHIYDHFLRYGLGRDAKVLIIGGGAVCDAAAFAAATYMRGISAIMVPTTLLSQVDAGVGGKNGINVGGYKNVVGTIRQPELVLCDPVFLKTLPAAELRSGFAEVIKHAVIADPAYFSFIQSNIEKARALDSAVMERIVYDSLVVKSGVVSRDELDTGERMKLNFGHTIGHAVEAVTKLSHGESVSIGMAAEARLSTERKMLSEDDYQSLLSLLKSFELPTGAGNCSASELKAAMKIDKKRSGVKVSATFLKGLGTSVIEQISMREMEGLIDALCIAGA